MLEHLGEKLILTVSIGGFSFSFDVITIGMSWVVIAILVSIAFILRRGLRQGIEEKPSRTQALLDSVVELLQGQLTANFASGRLARELFSFVSTIFLFVLFSNWLSVIPYCSSPTQDLNVTMSLALLVFFVSQVFAVRMKGGMRYLKGFIEPYPFLLPLNIISEVAKPVSHAFRLFGNVFGGMILITVVTAEFAPVVVPAALNAFYGLFIGAIQAFVFAILAVTYINVAVET
jgi:F-type H+-transporting ATPase subunit a